MSNHNYSQYSKKHDNENVTAVVTDSEIVAGPAIVDQLDVQTTPEVKMAVEPSETIAAPTVEPENVTGKVANCAKLNVRAKADATADVICVLDAATEVTIDVEKSTKEWFKVCTVNGVEGYCMRKFITANL